jgi:hypothetical protein
MGDLLEHAARKRRDTAQTTTKQQNAAFNPSLRRREAPKGANPEVIDKPNKGVSNL